MTSLQVSSNSNNTKQAKKQYLTHYECVGEFHETFGHPYRKELYEDCFTKEPKLIPFRISLMKEELDEFKEAFFNKDKVEMADALCDLSYVTNGAGLCLGLDLDNIMDKLKLSIKTPVDLDKNESNVIDENTLVIIKKELKEIDKYLAEFCGSVETENLEEMGNYLVYLLVSTYNLGHKLKFNMDKMFREVHRSNMTKVCSNIEDANESVRRYKVEGRYKEPAIKLKGQYYVVYDKATSKILKNYKWEVPDIKKYL